jgi:enoyl-CoA hydratase/carnithine racemase
MTAAPKPDEPLVLRRDADGVARLTLNRPHARNALSRPLMAALKDALDDVAADPAVRVVVLAANGPVFSAGHDLKELRSVSDRAEMAALFRQCSELMLAIVRLRQPVIARVHGVATAAGCQLVATCDLAVAAESARFATPGVNIGLFCSTPMVALTRAVGAKRSMEMLLTGEMLSARDAVEAGLVNRAVPDAELGAAVDALAAAIVAKSPRTLAIGKEAFHRQRDMDLAAAYDYAAEVMALNMEAEDAKEGIDAFLAKRPPVWKGC